MDYKLLSIIIKGCHKVFMPYIDGPIAVIITNNTYGRVYNPKNDVPNLKECGYQMEKQQNIQPHDLELYKT